MSGGCRCPPAAFTYYDIPYLYYLTSHNTAGANRAALSLSNTRPPSPWESQPVFTLRACFLVFHCAVSLWFLFCCPNTSLSLSSVSLVFRTVLGLRAFARAIRAANLGSQYIDPTR